MAALRSAFVCMPIICCIGWPCLNRINVGTLIIWYCAGVDSFSSTSSLPIFTAWPLYSPASSSTIGPSNLQGPHQLAQKSTNTGTSASSTSVLKFASVKTWAMDVCYHFIGFWSILPVWSCVPRPLRWSLLLYEGWLHPLCSVLHPILSR